MPTPTIDPGRPSLATSPTYAVLLVGAMAVSTVHLFGTSVLAADIIDEVDITRAELGIIGSANTAVGAVISPFLGSVTDRIGPRWSIVVLSLTGAVGLAVMAVAASVWTLVLSSAVSGFSQGWANPATNASIAAHLEAGERGTVTGLKQSGVQLTVFLTGATLPVAASTIGWRAAIWVYAGLSVAVAVLGLLRHPRDRAAEGATDAAGEVGSPPSAPLPRLVYRVALYALLLGLTGGSVFRFLPLFVEEEVGWSTEWAGLVIALNGLLAIVARIWWGRVTERGFSAFSALRIMALGSAVTSAMLLLAPQVPAIVWLFAVVAAFTASAWNVVAMLAVIGGVDVAQQGRATGVVIFGFLGGLSIGGPLTGWSVDATGDYRAAWVATILLAVLASAVVGDKRQR